MVNRIKDLATAALRWFAREILTPDVRAQVRNLIVLIVGILLQKLVDVVGAGSAVVP